MARRAGAAGKKGAPSSGAPLGLLRFFKPLRSTPAVDIHASSDASGPVAPEQRVVTETITEEKEATKNPLVVQEESDDESDGGDETPVAVEQSQVSEYERKRLARVAQNAQFLRELGVKAAQRDVSGALRTTYAAVKKPKQLKRLRETSGGTGDGGVGTRRSTRLRGIKLDKEQDAASHAVLENEQEDEIEELSYDDSSVLKYTCSRGDSSAIAGLRANEHPEGATLAGFRAANDTLADANLRRIYSISFSPFRENALVAAGGHQGHVSVYASPSSRVEATENDPAAPLMSFRAHRGWISSVSLARSSAEKNLLLSAANDGVVTFWDLDRSAGGIPKELLSVTDLHRNGIFGMDVAGDDVLTCSKDATIALSRLREDGSGLTISRRYEDHDGVVKCARFSPLTPIRVASGGNDKCIRIYDTRSELTTASQVITNAHTRSINSVAWHPTQEHVLLSASFDREMHLYDLRKPTSPLYVLSTSASNTAGTSIFHPSFVADGAFVVSTGAGSQDHLSLHRTLDGTTISRGELPAKASYVACDPWSGRLLVAMGQQLQFFDEEWRTT